MACLIIIARLCLKRKKKPILNHRDQFQMHSTDFIYWKVKKQEEGQAGWKYLRKKKILRHKKLFFFSQKLRKFSHLFSSPKGTADCARKKISFINCERNGVKFQAVKMLLIIVLRRETEGQSSANREQVAISRAKMSKLFTT